MDKLYNCDNEKLEAQHEFLRNELYCLNYYDNTKFKVLDFECGSGKTIKAEEFMADINNENNTYNYLFVRERNVDGIASAKRINELAKNEIAIAINTDTHTPKQFNEIKTKLKNYKVLIISHEKYKELSISTKKQKYFTENRDILIIDEFLDICKGHEIQISKEFIIDFETKLQYRELRNLYVEIIGELEDYLICDRKKNTFFNPKKDYNTVCKQINKLKLLIKNNLSVEYLDTIGYTKQSICNKLDEIKQFYNNQTCVVEGKIIYCIDKNYKYWLLPEHNIILDASGTLNPNYKLNNIFQLQTQSKVFNHKEWKFMIMKTNTNKSSKQRTIDLYDRINNMVSKNNEITLVIGSKEDEKYIQNAKYINHFMNLTGSNEYRNLQNIIIIHNPNLPYRQYILQYLYYSNVKLDNRSSWEGISCGSKAEMVYRFKDDKFENYRQMRNADNIYQAIKRVNRNMILGSCVFIFNNDVETIERVLKMFKGIKESNITYCENLVAFEKTKKEKYDEGRKENRQAMKFITLCKEIMEIRHTDLQKTKKNRKGEEEIIVGEYSKQKIREQLGIDKNNFSKLILKDIDVQNYLKRHNIIENNQSLNFNSAKK